MMPSKCNINFFLSNSIASFSLYIQMCDNDLGAHPIQCKKNSLATCANK
jgi:hypothetical protein